MFGHIYLTPKWYTTSLKKSLKTFFLKRTGNQELDINHIKTYNNRKMKIIVSQTI